MTNFLEGSNSSQKHILVIGAACLDIVGRLSSLPEPGTSTPAEVRPSFGGVARNISENLARLGQTVNLITAVGKDVFGHQLLEHTAASGVNIDASLEIDCQCTASYLAVVNTNGQLQFALDDMDVLTALDTKYLRQQSHLFKDASLVFVDSNLPPASLRTVLQIAHRHRTPLCADATSTLLAQRLLPHLSRLHLVTANTAEANVLCQGKIEVHDRKSAMQAARHLINQGVEIAVITMAEFGVCYATSETSGHIPAIRTKIINPTGVGDALTAALIFGLVNEIPIDDAIRLGVSAASLTLRHVGSVYPELSLEKLYDQLVL